MRKVPDADRQAGSSPAADDSGSPQGSSRRWWSSLWLWPAAAIGLAGIAGTLFGPIGVIFGAEALAVLGVTAGILFLSRDRWQTFCLATALVATLVTVAASIRLHELHQKGDHQESTAVSASSPAPSEDWPRQRISQAMVNDANLRGA